MSTAEAPAEELLERPGGALRAWRQHVRTLVRRAALLYLIALAASHLWRFANPSRTATPAELAERGLVSMQLAVQGGAGDATRDVRLAYTDDGPRDAPTLLMVHGSPGDLSSMRRVGDLLEDRFRVLNVDLPGFGMSDRAVPDYSIRAHAAYLVELLDRLDVPEVHTVGFSMGGGVALELDALLGERSRSITMLSAIGVQELELFGNYHMNHAIHGLQLAFAWFLCEGFPHFGAFDRAFFGIEYARNFYDTDQRPLRGLLEAYEKPMLIVHGERDGLVPMAAAREHARIVPHAELASFPDQGHFLVFLEPGEVAQRIASFVERTEAGTAATRSDAEPARLAESELPFDPASAPLGGLALWMVLGGIALSTLISEDLTCIGAGAMVAQGRVAFWPASAACFAGIVIGDLMLFFAGRLFGQGALRFPPFSWVLTRDRVENSAAWFERRGLLAIFATRFMPGTRLPTYFAAGALRANPLRFAVYFCIAAGLWVPSLVWLSGKIGGELSRNVEMFEKALPLAFVTTLAIGLVIVKVLVPALTWRGRRLLVGSVKCKLAWEFWPPWIVYPPVLLYVLWLGLRHRSLTLFCAANPGIEDGGFVGESKAEILESIADRTAVPRTLALPRVERTGERIEHFRRFADEVGYPVVVKPDAGQRGSGVRIAGSEEEVDEYLRDADLDLLVQEHVAGPEYGVLWTKRPGAAEGRITSITVKLLPEVVGDGNHTLEHLILKDPRAVCMAKTYFKNLAAHLQDVPAPGQRVRLTDLGTHVRGAVFLDGRDLETPELRRRVEEIATSFEGFHLGRFDLRAPDEQAFRDGRGLKVIELNGVTSEPAHIYDPRHSYLTGLRALCAQWRTAFEIGAANRERGAAVPGTLELLRAWHSYRRGQRAHA